MTRARFLLCATAVLLVPAIGAAQTVTTGPRGGVAVSGPRGAVAAGPNGGVAAARRHPYGGSTGRSYYYRGQRYHGVYAAPFVYPRGWAYRRWAVGAVLLPFSFPNDAERRGYQDF